MCNVVYDEKISIKYSKEQFSHRTFEFGKLHFLLKWTKNISPFSGVESYFFLKMNIWKLENS